MRHRDFVEPLNFLRITTAQCDSTKLTTNPNMNSDEFNKSPQHRDFMGKYSFCQNHDDSAYSCQNHDQYKPTLNVTQIIKEEE